MTTKPVTARLPAELVQRLDEYADRLERSRGSIVKQAVADWIERQAERDRLTCEALSSADSSSEQGWLIDNDRVEEWLESELASSPVRIETRGRVAVAVAEERRRGLTAGEVEQTRDALRNRHREHGSGSHGPRSLQ